LTALARVAGLHANSIRYLERQERITTGFSRERVEQAMLHLGVIFFDFPSPGVRLRPMEKEFGWALLLRDNFNRESGTNLLASANSQRRSLFVRLAP
jgi:hypothetical protein